MYLGNQQGELIALHADGKPYWRRSIAPRQAIVASPVIGSDGMVYVIGIEKYTDHTVSPPKQQTSSYLHRFTASGGWLGGTPFPEHGGAGAAGAAPNIWKYQGTELIVVPVAYANKFTGGYEIRLIAFKTSGGVAADTRVTTFVPEVGGGLDLDMPAWKPYTCLIPPFVFCTIGEGFEAEAIAILPPAPSAGIFTYAGGGTPFVLVSDHLKDLVGYTIENSGFVEIFRAHDENRYLRTAPVILPDGHTIVGYQNARRNDDGVEEFTFTGGVVFGGPNMNKVAQVSGLAPIYATPARMANGRIAAVGDNQITILDGNQVAATIQFPGRSIAQAAASRSHLFLSTSAAFLSYDTNSLAEVGRSDWIGGEQNPPAIGPDGHVYALASNVLFVFPGPRQMPVDMGLIAQPPGMLIIDPATPTSQLPSHTYSPPLVTSGNRLFACEELDQDDCGPGDYKAIALAFCQKEGYGHADDLDVDTRKTKAERLDGQFCSKKKCKVFDRIVCKM